MRAGGEVGLERNLRFDEGPSCLGSFAPPHSSPLDDADDADQTLRAAQCRYGQRRASHDWSRAVSWEDEHVVPTSMIVVVVRRLSASPSCNNPNDHSQDSTL